jgi:hypothetical protein
MTSAINYNNIDGTYPVAGQDNSSQGFRDNFTNIKSNFESAYDEITDLQNKVLLKSPLDNGVFNNDMQGNIITNPTLQGSRDLLYNLGTAGGILNIDFNTGSYQTVTLASSSTLSFSNFAGTTGNYTKVRIQVTVPNTGYTLTFPASVSIATDSIAGLAGQTVTFDNTGTYVFELGTTNGGTTFILFDLTRARKSVQGGGFYVTANIAGATQNGVYMTVANVGGVAVGNIYATNVFANIISTGGASASFTGTVTANTLVANTGIAGTLTTAAQPNITLVGTLSSVSVSGNANIGNLTTTGMTDMCGGTQYGIQYVSLSNSGSQQLFSNVGAAIVEFTSNISTATITMPATPVDGQAIKIGFGNNTCATLSQTATGGQTILGAATAGNATAGGTWVYYTAKTTWYKVG